MNDFEASAPAAAPPASTILPSIGIREMPLPTLGLRAETLPKALPTNRPPMRPTSSSPPIEPETADTPTQWARPLDLPAASSS